MWQLVLTGLYLFRDSCNVYALECPEGMVLVNAGTGEWLKHMDQLPKRCAALACTHYFRDHSAGAAEAADYGIRVFVPEYEEEIFTDPNQHFRQRESYIVYDNLWDRFSPILPTEISGVLRDYDVINLAGREFQIVPLPGVTCGQVGLLTILDDGRKMIFTGEAIHSHGRIARIAPLQYNYNDLSGAIQACDSVRRLLTHKPSILLPSLGEPILKETENALLALKSNLGAILSVRPNAYKAMQELELEELEHVTEHVWRDRKSVANTWYLVSDSGKVLAMDYGYHLSTASSFPGYPKKDRRRALLHGTEALKEKFRAEKIDVVLVSHFHDDHVCGIPVLQRMHGTECWCPENFSDLLEQPEAHTFPCGWPVPIIVNRKLPLDQTFEWEEYTFHMSSMSGHTRFAALIGFEADGKRFAHTGDQYFFDKGATSFGDNSRSQNHVYQNGALLDGYEQSGQWMLNWRPDIVIQGHQPAMFTDEHFFRHISEWTQDYADLARNLMPLGEEESHFNLDSWGGWIWPYRITLKEPGPFSVRVTVRNPHPKSAELSIHLVGPNEWTSETRTIHAAPRAELSCELTMLANFPCRRQPIAVELHVNGKPLGQVAEALVTVSQDFKW